MLLLAGAVQITRAGLWRRGASGTVPCAIGLGAPRPPSARGTEAAVFLAALRALPCGHSKRGWKRAIKSKAVPLPASACSQ